MEKLNVCLINDSFPPAIDGVANAVTNYAKIISSSLGSVEVATPFYPNADDSAFDFPIIRYPSLDTTDFVGYRAGLPFSAETFSQLEAAKPDIIHSHCPITSTMLARSLRDRVNVPIVMTYHTKFDIDIANALHTPFMQQRAAEILVENISACDEIWTVSRGAGENLRSLGYEGDYIVMPNGVDFPRGRVDDAFVREVTKDYELPEGLPVFLFVGRMMWYKGIKIILDALKILKDSGKDFRMVFIGAGGDKDEIVSYCSTLMLDDKVFFSPAIHDRNIIRAWYCRADLFLFPSTFDTNGLVVREAAACALASVLVKGSCAAEDSTDGVNGFLIDENAESMAAKLSMLCDAPEAVKSAGEHAQKELYMSWEEAVNRAYERYFVVIDKFKAGEYPAHDRLTDEFFHRGAEVLDKVISHRAQRQKRHDELMRLEHEALAGIEKRRSDIIERIEKLK